MRRRWLVMVVLGMVATGCGGNTQDQIFRQAGVEAAKGNAWSRTDCQMAARAEVDSQAKDHPGWTTTQRSNYEAAYVDGCLSALKPLQGTAQ
jgi:type II secretory pathway pseudopilin PulG